MKIKNIFKNERKEMLKFITNLPEDNCIENFNKYLDSLSEDDFEKRYIYMLNIKYRTFVETVLKNKYNKMSKEKLIEIITEAYLESPYSYESFRDNNDFIINNTDNLEEAYRLIRDYMGECYNLLIAEIDSSKK